MWRTGLSARGVRGRRVVAVTAGPAAAAVPSLKIVKATVDGDQATVVYRTNAKTTRPKTRVCTLGGAPTGCGVLKASTDLANT